MSSQRYKRSRAKRVTSCGKTRFRDAQTAKLALAKIRNVATGSHPVRWYRCERCKGFHLTSQE